MNFESCSINPVKATLQSTKLLLTQVKINALSINNCQSV